MTWQIWTDGCQQNKFVLEWQITYTVWILSSCIVHEQGEVNLSLSTTWWRIVSGGVTPLILNLGARWRWGVSIMPRPGLLDLRKEPNTNWTGGCMGPNSQSRCFGKEKYFLMLTEFEPHRACGVVSIPTALTRLFFSRLTKSMEHISSWEGNCI
jgi:hypothetical protein